MTDYFKNLVDQSIGGIFIIAEGCDNHMGSIDIAYAIIDAALFAGADAIKFQHHLVDVEMISNNNTSDNFKEPLYEFLKRNALSLDEHEKLKKYCDSKNIIYLCTPFSYEAAKQINHIVEFFKIGSGEFQDFWYLDQLATFNKPVIFSTGMCTDSEINDWLIRNKLKYPSFSLLNCVSEYPPDLNDMNLDYIINLTKKTNSIIGHSDHTTTLASSIIAVSNGARIIEKHITISKFVDGPDAKVSLDPNEFKSLIKELRNIRGMLGIEKVVQDKEFDIRKWAYRSLVATNELSEGVIIEFDDICSKRPGIGIPSREYEKVIGKKTLKTIDKNTLIKWEDLE